MPCVTSPVARVVCLAVSVIELLPAYGGIAVLIVVPGGPATLLLNCPVKGLPAQKLLSGLLASVQRLSIGADRLLNLLSLASLTRSQLLSLNCSCFVFLTGSSRPFQMVNTFIRLYKKQQTIRASSVGEALF